jgi:hypothetical protein
MIYFRDLDNDICLVKEDRMILVKDSIFTQSGIVDLYLLYDIEEIRTDNNFEYYIHEVVYDYLVEKYPESEKDRKFIDEKLKPLSLSGF